jgi:hypothetical protein
LLPDDVRSSSDDVVQVEPFFAHHGGEAELAPFGEVSVQLAHLEVDVVQVRDVGGLVHDGEERVVEGLSGLLGVEDLVVIWQTGDGRQAVSQDFQTLAGLVASCLGGLPGADVPHGGDGLLLLHGDDDADCQHPVSRSCHWITDIFCHPCHHRFHN